MAEICDNDGRFWVLGHEMRESEMTEIELVNIENFHFLPEMPGWSGTNDSFFHEVDLDKKKH